MSASTPAAASGKPAPTPYFTPAEVATHSAPEDLWLSWLGKVYNLTALAAKHNGDPLMLPILKNAGKDISHWFDPKTRDIKRQINPNTGASTYYFPEGRFLHVPPPCPRADYSTTTIVTPWWQDASNCIGHLSRNVRSIRLVNTLTRDESVLEVCGEESLLAIQARYQQVTNAHANGYTWKRLGRLLEMSRTLEGNGVPDERSTMEALDMDEDEFLPVLHLYFSDDLTVA